MKNPIGTFEFVIRTYECGADGEATLASVMNYLQESAARQAEACGFSKGDFAAIGANTSWVLTRLHLQMTRFPRWQEKLTVETWPSGEKKIIAERDFILKVGDERIGAATSEWVLIDLDTRKIAVLPPSLADMFKNDVPRAMGDDHAFARLKWDCREITSDARHFVARRGDIDLNNHVNNVHYVEWLIESMPENAMKPHDFQIAYKSETLVGDEVTAESVETEPGVYLSRVASADGRDHAIARSKIS